MMDWRLDPRRDQNYFDDLYSQLSFRPRSWVTFESQVRYDLDGGNLDLAFHQITFTPNDRWSWGIGHLCVCALYEAAGAPGQAGAPP